jgi:hypothetical protein
MLYIPFSLSTYTITISSVEGYEDDHTNPVKKEDYNLTVTLGSMNAYSMIFSSCPSWISVRHTSEASIKIQGRVGMHAVV